MKIILITSWLACSLLAASLPAAGQEPRGFPTKPVRVVSSAAGSQTDLLSRMIGSKLSDQWSQPVVIENRSGAGGALAASIVAKAAPDGYTLLFQSPQFAVNAALNEKLPYDPIKDFAGITRVGLSTVVVVVSPGLGVKTVKEFMSLAKTRPTPIMFGSSGAGSSMHMNAERFKFASGITATHVGFKGASEAVIEVVAGRLQYATPALTVALPLLRDGKLTALAVLNPQRSPTLPDVQAIVETFPGYGRDGSYTLFAPAGTPRALLQKINKDVAQLLTLPDIKERLQRMEFDVATSTPEETDRMTRADIDTFRKVARQAGLIAK